MSSSLYDRFADAAARFPDRVAVAPADCPPLSYAELHRRINAFAMELDQAGAAGQRVGLLLPNLTAFPVAFYAVLRGGGSALLLNPLYSPREIAEYTGDAGVEVVITIEALEHLLPPGIRALLVDPADCGSEERSGIPAAPAHPDAEAEAAVIYTAATDGWARGARLTHRSLGANLVGVLEAMQLGPEDRVFALLPFVHAFGLTVTLTAPLSAGATVIPVERFHAVRSVDLLETSEATVVCGVPAMYLGLIAAAERRGVPIHRLRVAICGGAPLRPEVARRWEDTFGIPLREGYGLTECSPVCLFNRVDQPNRAGTLGFPFPGVEVTLRDPRGELVPRGETGEICIAGANVFAGYVGDDGRNPDHFWDQALRTGDLGCQDADGAVQFRGVCKAMFTRSGYNIFPREIERVLEEDPRIAQAAVTPLPDPAKENEIELTVAAAPGVELDEAAVREICRAALAAYKQPGTVVVEGP
jgi:acyl-CoA synthetase (AMP-forming)/AMP-acid ligase II